MDKQVNVIILGGGPAGAACGIALQRQGVANCIIDKAVFPRPKTCGGMVTEKTYRLLRPIFDDDEARLAGLFCRTETEVAAFDNTTLLAHCQPELPLRLADRFHFDNELVRRYRELGGTLFEGQREYTIDYDGRAVTLEDGSRIAYRYLVFADGALSRAHRDFGIRRELSFCVETFLPGDALETRGGEIHFGVLADGYLWVFPYGDRVCVGLGCTYEKGFPYRETLAGFLRETGVSPEGQDVRGAFVPCGWTAPQDRLPDNVLLIGDAGGFVDPIYGEGLYFALLSGRMAAEALAADDPKRTFLRNMQPAYQIIRNGKKLQPFLFSPLMRKGFINRLRGRNGFLKYYCDHQMSVYAFDHNKAKIMTAYRRQKKGK